MDKHLDDWTDRSRAPEKVEMGLLRARPILVRELEA
jgi:hypothetical protein